MIERGGQCGGDVGWQGEGGGLQQNYGGNRIQQRSVERQGPKHYLFEEEYTESYEKTLFYIDFLPKYRSQGGDGCQNNKQEGAKSQRAASPNRYHSNQRHISFFCPSYLSPAQLNTPHFSKMTTDLICKSRQQALWAEIQVICIRLQHKILSVPVGWAHHACGGVVDSLLFGPETDHLAASAPSLRCLLQHPPELHIGLLHKQCLLLFIHEHHGGQSGILLSQTSSLFPAQHFHIGGEFVFHLVDVCLREELQGESPHFEAVAQVSWVGGEVLARSRVRWRNIVELS